MVSSYCHAVYRFHLRNLKNVDLKADKVITLGGVIYIVLKDRIILKLKERDVLCWNIKPK